MHWQYDVVPPASISQQVSGGFGGFQAGYNFQIRSFVLGIEGDYEFAISTRPASAPIRFSSATPSRAISPTSRAASALPGTGCLFYAKGGEAWAFNRYESLATPNTIGGAETRSGWLGGVGIEYAYDPCWTVKAEYNYVGLRNDGRDATNANGSPAIGMDVSQKNQHRQGRINYNSADRWSRSTDCAVRPATHSPSATAAAGSRSRSTRGPTAK